MKKLIWPLLVFTIFTTSCKKDTPAAEDRFVPGDLTVGITNNAELKTVFDTLNVLNLKISKMDGFFYTANLPADSLKPLLTYLNTKPYINTGTGRKASAYYYEPEKTIRVLSSLFDMTLSNQIDFLNTIDSLKLIDRHEDTKDMLIKVPIGQEKYWLNELKKYSFIKWTELNHIREIII